VTTGEEPIDDAALTDTAPVEVSAARGAFATRDFRVIWLGALASNLGTWMQNVTLGAFAYKLTRSPTYVGIVYLAQLGPILLLAPFVGPLADVHDRRKLILLAQSIQASASLALFVVAIQDRPNRAVLAATVMVLGAANSMNVPAWYSLVSTLVPRRHLAGAISLNATQLNLTRVIGPVIGAFVYKAWGAAPVFLLNAGTYLFMISAVLAVATPPFTPAVGNERGLQRFAEAMRAMWADEVLRRALLTVSLLSLFSLAFLGQMPTIADHLLDMDPKSVGYGVLNACLGVGTVIGALAVGTVLSRRDKHQMVVAGLTVLAVASLAFSVLSHPLPAYAVAVVLGSTYFAITTSLITIVQTQTPDHLRGRVSAIFQAGWAGCVPVGALVGGIVAQATSIRIVLLYGGVSAGLLARYAARLAARSPQ
jgi:MFS family permease